jgi:hypothetical protein
MSADIQSLDLPARDRGGALPPGTSGATGASDIAVPATRLRWRDGVSVAVLALVERPALVAVGLLGFLSRGGLVAFLLPIVVLPTPIGIANYIGGDALTGAGATDSLIRLIAVSLSIVVLGVVLGSMLGAFADLLLVREGLRSTLARERGVVTERGLAAVEQEVAVCVPGTWRAVLRLLAIRGIAVIPVTLAVLWASTRFVQAGYDQLTLTVPTDLSVPLVLRILTEAKDAAIVVVIVWLASELIGGIAVRQALVGRRSVIGAIGAAIWFLLRRPITTLGTYGLGVVGVALVAAPIIVGADLLWGRLQAFLIDDQSVLLVLPATLVFVLVWAGGLLAVGAAAAWRSILATAEIARARTDSTALATGSRGPTPEDL